LKYIKSAFPFKFRMFYREVNAKDLVQTPLNSTDEKKREFTGNEEVISMESDEKTITDDKGKSNTSESNTERSCCYVVDPCVRYVDPCGYYVDPCGCYTSSCCC
jgi:hypothetical protein